MDITPNTQTQTKPNTIKILMLEITSSRADLFFAIFNGILIFGAALVLIGTIGAIILSGVREQFANERISANEAETLQAIAVSSVAKSAAAKASLETERLRTQVAWRRISLEQHKAIINSLAGHRFAMYFEFSQSDPEAVQFAEDIFKSLKDSPGITVHPPHPLVMPPAPPGVTVSGSAGRDKDALKAALHKAKIEFSPGPILEGAPRLSVGSKKAPF